VSRQRRDRASPNAPEPISLAQVRRSRLLRRVGLAFIALIVLAGGVGLLGIRTRTVTATDGGYSITLQYPWTDRSNEPINWVLAVRKVGGFSGPGSIRITQSYLDLLNMNGIEPEPSSSS
jgi:hypothetical protein